MNIKTSWLFFLIVISYLLTGNCSNATAVVSNLGVLQQVSHDNKILPQPSGTGGVDSLFGNDVTIEGHRALVSGLKMGTNNSGSVYVYEFNNNTWEKVTSFESPDTQRGDDSFGQSISLSNDRALVGAPNHDVNFNLNQGAAYIYGYEGNNWAQVAKLVASDFDYQAQFGYSVFISGDQIIVGSPGKKSESDDLEAGAVYVFENNGTNWIETAMLTSSDFARFQRFGTSVVMAENQLFVGSVNSSHQTNVAGGVYVFEKVNNEWVETQKIVISDAESGDRIGHTISFNNSRLMIGKYNSVNDHLGAAYIFEYDGNNWIETAHLQGFDTNELGRIGSAVDLSGEFAVIGATSYYQNGYIGTGLAYVFKYDGLNWELVKKLTASDKATGDEFGSAVSIFDDHIFIGANGRSDERHLNVGASYSYQLNGVEWEEIDILIPGGSKLYLFGSSLGMSEGRIIVGTNGGYHNTSFTGYAFIFEHDGTNWKQTAKLNPDEGEIYDVFGTSVSISGNRALIGSPTTPYNSGIASGAYIYHYNGFSWVETTKLLPSNSHINDYFGRSVQIQNNRAVVSASGNNENGVYSGAVVVFEYINNNWVETAILTASDGFEYDIFGNTVVLQGDKIAVGASSAVYIFDYNGSEWIETTKLVGTNFTLFASSISLSDDRILIGSKSRGHGSGKAYIFELADNIWSETAVLEGDETFYEEAFGSSVSLLNNRAVIGANGQYDPENALGTAYVFDYDGVNWNRITRLSSIDEEFNRSFGAAVTQSDDWIVVGAPGTNDFGVASGSAYTFNTSLDLIFKNSF